MRVRTIVLAGALCLCANAAPAGESPALGPVRVTQEKIEGGELSFDELRLAGLRMFTTLFNKLDGYGDGPMNVVDPVSPGGRPTLQGNGTFLRVNGLDAQGCIECHSIVSAAAVPPVLGIGGVGTVSTNALIKPTAMSPADHEDLDGAANFNGRFANPPFLFGAGAVELLAQEMSQDLARLADLARSRPGVPVPLRSKGVDFGVLVADAFGALDTSGVAGVSPDLIVRPFGRKGEFATLREFDIEAVQFHFGMQPVELVGDAIDGDGDGVTDEILEGELSALGIFLATLERARMAPLGPQARSGFTAFKTLGCAACHVPELETRSTTLGLRFPEVASDPQANVYVRIDLTRPPVAFEPNGKGGIRVPLFADLKRHDMGPGLAETFDLADEATNRSFTTARLWGVADTAPYLHDGRATTLTEAILLHGGEAQAARDGFAAAGEETRDAILAFLRSLRTPPEPARDLVERSRAAARR